MMDWKSRMDFDKVNKSKIPANISIVNHVAGRIRELTRLHNDISTTKTDMLLHQMLPNSMRRRAMSHNPKRLPLKYRQIHTNQMAKSGPNAKKKRPSRKYRRKPSNLMKEYLRRKQKNVWLETHIWHAKRYHMKELWGYKIPYAPTDKRYIASYKAVVEHCLLQDISYVSAIEISGPLDPLRESFRRITSQEIGPTIMAKCYQNGTREGETDIFRIDSYPANALTRITFLWKSSEDKRKTLWLFVHPTAYQEVLQELVVLFQLQNCNRNGDDGADTRNIIRNDSSLRNPKYTNLNSEIELVELKDTLNRYRLTGPLSNAVLLKAFKPSTVLEKSCLKSAFDENPFLLKAHNEQENFWNELQKISSPSEIPPHSIIGLNIVDPRSNRPAKREMAEKSLKAFNMGHYVEIAAVAAKSAIWDIEVRDNVTKSMKSTSEICKLRNTNQLVPGVASSVEKDLQPIPILLIQRPGVKNLDSKRLGYGCGWDLIIPSGYGLSVWLSLIRCGAKSGGCRETETISHETGRDLFPPDSVSGRKENERLHKLRLEEYFRKPPNKRINYKKMGITSPFSCPFDQLVKEWNRSGKFHVLRDISTLEKLKEVLEGKISIKSLNVQADLIPVSVSLEGGTPGDLAILCLPSKRDIKNTLSLKYRGDKGPVFIEPLIKDSEEKERKLLRSNHKKLLKRLRNRRVRAKRKLQATSKCFIKIQKSTAEKIIEEQYAKICELWLPKTPLTIRRQCSKDVFGYLSTSRFTFSEGKVRGIGYVTKDGLACLLNVFQKFKGLKPFVLTRSSNSRCYHSAGINIRMNS